MADVVKKGEDLKEFVQQVKKNLVHTCCRFIS